MAHTTVTRGGSLALACALVGGLAACSVQDNQTQAVAATGQAPSATTSSVAAAPAASVKVYPADKASGVLPSATVTVRAGEGTLKSVAVKESDGTPVPGTIGADGWHSTSRLRPSVSYTVRAEAVNADGVATAQTSTFSTLKPESVAQYDILPSQSTVGVGMPVSIQFATKVTTKEQRAAVEKNVTVTTSPATEGSWGWLDNRQLMWRPKDYWNPGTKVLVKTNLHGLQTGDSKWVGRDGEHMFTIGANQVSTVNMRTHEMTVTRGGQVQRVIPVTTGKDGFTTRSGTKVIIEKVGKMTMDSATVGIPKGNKEYYKLDTQYNMRVTWTGEFLHSAPWSVGAQGRDNVSHGCTNMSAANARWMFGFSQVGDVVKFTGSNRPFLPVEGIGVWQYTYDQWKKQSALA